MICHKSKILKTLKNKNEDPKQETHGEVLRNEKKEQ
jgi:hypothetical protein